MAMLRKRKSSTWIVSLAIGFLAASAMMTPRTAQALVCPQCATEMTQIMNQMNLMIQRAQAAAEYGEEAMRWRQTFAQYQQQLVRIQGIISGFGMPQGPELVPVALNHNVATRCGGFNISSLTKVFNLDGAGNIYEQQKQICANIQMMENMKYNATVEFLTKTAAEMKAEMQSLEARRGISNENGNVDASTNDAVRMMNSMEGKFKIWETQVGSYDAYIQTMQGTQKILAQGALKGKREILGAIVKTASMCAALKLSASECAP